MARSRGSLFVDPSDESYGADRILVEVLNQVEPNNAVVWLVERLEYPERQLSKLLASRGFKVLRVPLPVLRRSYLRLRLMPWLVLRLLRSTGRLLTLRPRLVYLNTSACLPLAPAARLAGART